MERRQKIKKLLYAMLLVGVLVLLWMNIKGVLAIVGTLAILFSLYLLFKLDVQNHAHSRRNIGLLMSFLWLVGASYILMWVSILPNIDNLGGADASIIVVGEIFIVLIAFVIALFALRKSD